MTIAIFISIFILYLIFLLIRVPFLKVCPICAAVFLTWFIFSIFYLLGMKVNLLLLALLMGQSISGIMYLAERGLRNRNVLFKQIFKLAYIISATLLFLFILNKRFPETVIMFSALVLVFLINFAHFSKKQSLSNKNIVNKALKAFEKKLKHCCD